MRPLLYGAACSALFLAACFSPGDGQEPPANKVYFPTGVALDSVDGLDAHHLYIASSDFDLQYKSSVLLALDLDAMKGVLPKPCNTGTDCGALSCDNQSSATHVASHFCVDTAPCPLSGERSAADKLLHPGLCNPIAMDPLIAQSVGIGAFATDIIFRKNPDPNQPQDGRLFIPVRGDATLHWIQWSGDQPQNLQLECGQALSSDQSCDDGHRAGKKASESPAHLRMVPEPFGLDATRDGREIVVTNQTSGMLSLFYNQWLPSGTSVTLTDQLAGLPPAPVTAAFLPDSSAAQPGFLIGYSDAAQIDLVRVDVAGQLPSASLPGPLGYPLIYHAGTSFITANSIGSDSRDIAVYTPHDAAGVASGPTSVFVANRAPPSLLIGTLRRDPESADLPVFTDSVPLSAGPSRVVVGHVLDPSGVAKLRVFVVCFDSRQLFIYDPELRQMETEVRTGRGPYAITIDETRNLAYLAHFTDSYLGVISLDQRFPDTYATMIATIGYPQPPRASK